ncbi:GNAT family N-acetyltransferase [Ferrovibrio terrae]|uniref:GNAT family N-acetyltransferase n=1 Tax=Ferrovibrio terrae TaxID=2594003 RepID=UPI003137E9AC
MSERPTAILRPITEVDAEGYRACLDRVAAERRYLAFTAAPALSEVKFYLKAMLQRGLPFIVAVDPQHQVVGWCNIHVQPQTPHRNGFAHVGTVGMGLDAAWRGQGLGRRMLQTVFDTAGRVGIERVELQVYASNESAVKLYRKFGFVTEGVKSRARKLDGEYDDIIMMARLRPPQSGG